MKKIKKAILLSVLALIAISFSGCINLQNNSNKNSDSDAGRNDHQGVFRSADGGRTWEHKVKIQDSEEQLDNVKISSFKMDPQNHKVLYLGTVQNGLYKSEDGTDTWKKVKDKNNILSETATIYDIDIEKGNSNIVYIAVLNSSRGELLKSEDGGKSWKESYISSQPGKQINAIQIDPVSRNVVYIGTEQGGFIKSENRGNDWLTLNWFNTGVKDFTIDFANTNGIIVRTANEISKTKDGGKNWESLNNKIVRTLSLKVAIAQISSMKIDNKDPFTVYITYLNLILVTRDGGDNWEKLNTITPAKTAVGTIPQVKELGLINNIIYYGAGNVLYKSSNKGITWSSYDIPIKGDVRYTVSDYTDPNIIYLGAFYEPPKKK